MQFKTPKDIKISVAGEYWERLPELQGKHLVGTIARWVRKEVALTVVWEDGADTEHLDQLFHPEAALRFEPYANGKPAPKLTGRAAYRAGMEAERNVEAAAETVSIPYVDGGA